MSASIIFEIPNHRTPAFRFATRRRGDIFWRSFNFGSTERSHIENADIFSKFEKKEVIETIVMADAGDVYICLGGWVVDVEFEDGKHEQNLLVGVSRVFPSLRRKK
jgi:hypothetical protein